MNIEKFKPSIALAIVTSMCVVFSVLTVIFLLNKSFFLTTDIFKLLIIGIGCASPLLMLNFLLLFYRSEFRQTASETVTDWMIKLLTYSSAYCIFILSTCILSLIFRNGSPIDILYFLIFWEIGPVVFAVYSVFKKEKN